MRHASSVPVVPRRALTARTILALAGIAWGSCAMAQSMPPDRRPSVQAPGEEPSPDRTRREMMERLRDAQLAPEQPPDQAEPEPDEERPDGGGLTGEGMFSIDIEGPMDLSAFVELVSESLQINIIEPAALQGHTILFRAPLAIPIDEVLPFLRALLDDAGFALVYEQHLGFYRIRQEQELMPDLRGPLPTTRVIPTPLVRPSALVNLINQQVGQQQPAFRLTPIDELGILIVTGTPESLGIVEEITGEVVSQHADQRLFPFRLENVSAVYARSRIIQLNGQLAPAQGAPSPQAAQAGIQGALSNLDSRLFLDQGNTLLFRGTQHEAERVANMIEVVDRIAPLIVKRYVAGSVAMEAARAGERLGLGPISTIEDASGGFPQRGRTGAQQQLGPALESEPAVSGFTVDVPTGSIIYYGTESQHRAVEDLIDQFKATSIGENIEIKTYKLLYAKAEGGDEEEGAGVVGILQELIQEPELQTTRSPFIPETSRRTVQGAQEQRPELQEVLEDAGIAPGEAGGTRLIATTENTIIVSDPARNQIIIKAPARAQEQFEKIIRQLDQKQPQVMITVQLVSLVVDEGFNWSADVQFNVGQFTWFSGFGVTGAPDSGDPFDPRAFPTPDPGNGLTTGIIKSDMVPIAIQTLSTFGDTRVRSEPQILINDNQPAVLSSIQEVPFSQSSQGTATTITSQGGTAEAGTTLEVTPRISEGGDITLEFSVELSSFTGQAQGGLQPPAQRDNFDSVVTLPSDSTVVVGGFRLNRSSQSERKVPILGDIPLLGAFFKSYNEDARDAVIFVFITPRVMRDPFGADLQLITEGPMAEVGLEPDVPILEPALMPIVGVLGAERRLVPSNQASDLGVGGAGTEEPGPGAGEE